MKRILLLRVLQKGPLFQKPHMYFAFVYETICGRVCVFVDACVYVDINVCICIYIYIYIFIHTYIRIRMRTYIRICTCTSICTCIVCVHIYVYTYVRETREESGDTMNREKETGCI